LPSECPWTAKNGALDQHGPANEPHLARTLCVAKITRPKEPVPKVTPASNWLINIGSGSFHSILR
jgi:hypothetical protein